MALIDNGIYVDGVRRYSPSSLAETYERLHQIGGMAWIGLFKPTEEELASVQHEFSLHPRAISDARRGHQRPKLERYGHTLFMVLRPAWYIDETESVQFGEIHVFVGSNFVITVRHAARPELTQVRARMEGNPELLRHGPEAVLYAVLDEVIDQFGPVVAGLENDIDEIEDQLFGEDDDDVSRRIYELLGEVISFQRATIPLRSMIEGMLRGSEKYRTDDELRTRFQSSHEHVLRLAERADEFRTLLESALTVHSTLVTQEQNEEMRRLSEASFAQAEETKALSEQGISQNEEMKKITSWAAILFAPSLIGAIYGMNFENMPELEWEFGYPAALLAMLAFAGGLYGIFKWKKWL